MMKVLVFEDYTFLMLGTRVPIEKVNKPAKEVSFIDDMTEAEIVGFLKLCEHIEFKW